MALRTPSSNDVSTPREADREVSMSTRDFLKMMGAGLTVGLMHRVGLSADDGKPTGARPIPVKELETMLKEEEGRVKEATVKEATAAGESCVEDRRTEPSLGTPGGDLGSANIVVSVGEELAHAKLLEPGIQRIVDKVPEFNFHTDEITLQKIVDELNDRDELKERGLEVRDTKHLMELLRTGSGYRNVDVIVEELFITKGMKGCGWGADAEANSQDYGFRKDQPGQMTRTAVKRSMRDSHAHLEVMKGKHGAGAVVDVDTGRISDLNDTVLMVQPSTDKGKMFVICSELARFRMNTLFIPQMMKEFPSINEQALKDGCWERLQHNSNVIAGKLADGLPYDILHYDRRDPKGTIEVEQKFIVGEKH